MINSQDRRVAAGVLALLLARSMREGLHITIFATLLLPIPGVTGRLSRTLFLCSLAFFATATWEVCGLGSTGRMLHPAQGGCIAAVAAPLVRLPGCWSR